MSYDQEVINQCITALNNMGINCLALDFDLTLINTHTNGNTNKGPVAIASCVRPVFKALIPKAVDAGIRIVVVTFSPQVDLIREVLGLAFPSIADQFVIRGNDKSWTYSGAGSTDRKQGHIASSFEELAMRGEGSKITRASTLLIDDDPDNIRAALLHETPAVLLNPNEPDELFESLKKLPPQIQ
eukprot:CAMPEP_0172597458 /NCGR_PEP_ID=MMETSP1068-20121228/17476_1 /TAXON_ID=35684 /ORGANISM="Pseudopedinella elastica, Strain CCMP716" /LENGTH=184 /DNA_ID=CAMNT_0013396997 /DNA_START=71 /DNA_END=625 /DNA_ORIENTATION=+